MKCPRCGHEWLKRVEKPQTCPRCKRRLEYWNIEDVEEDMKKRAKLVLEETEEPIYWTDLDELAQELVQRYIERIEG